MNKFNITELIEHYYSEGIALPEKFKKLNYKEIITQQITVSISGSHPGFTHKEASTTAENIIKYLPFEAFKEIFTLDWLMSEKRENKPIIDAVVHKQFDLISCSLDLIEKEINSNVKPHVINNESLELVNNVLNPLRKSLISITFEDLDYSSRDMAEFFTVWQHGLAILEKNMNSFRIGYPRELGTDTAKKYNNTETSDKDPIFTLLDKLATHKLYLNTFIHIFEALSINEQKHYSQKGVAEKALSSFNKKLVDYLEMKDMITDESYKSAMMDIFDIEKPSDKKSDKLWLYKKINSGIKDKTLIHSYHVMGMIDAFKNNDTIIDDIITQYPQLHTSNILNTDTLTFKELSFMIETAQSIDITLAQIYEEVDNGLEHIIRLIPLLKDKLCDDASPNTHLIQKSSLSDKIVDIYTNEHNVSQDEARTAFLEASIRAILPEKISTPRIKI